MRPYAVIVRLLALVAVVLFWSAPAAAQPRLEIGAEVDVDTVAVGDRVQLTLQAMAEGASPSDPRPGTTTGFTVQGTSVAPSTMVSIGNGVRSMKSGLTATWMLRADRIGTFKIGPPSIAINGARQAARPITITVVAPGRAPQRRAPGGIFGLPQSPINPMDPFKGLIPGFDEEPAQPKVATDAKLGLDAPLGDGAFLHAVIDKSNVVIGEQVTLTVYLYEDANERTREFNDVHEVTAGDFVKRSLLENDAQARPVGNALVGGRLWTVKLARKSALFPLKTGNLDIGPMSLALARVRPGANGKRESEALVVRVSEPEVAGRPPGFVVGDVGQFRLTAEVTPRELDADGALGVTIELEGTGNLPSTLTVPSRAGVEWLEPQMHEKLGATADDKFGGKRTFSYVVRMKKEGNVELGDITLPYFDPDTRTYAVARAALGGVHVKAGAIATVTEKPIEKLPGLPSPRATRAEPRRSGPHLADSMLLWFGLAAGPLAYAFLAGTRAATHKFKTTRAARASSPATSMKACMQAADGACKADDARAADAAIARALESAAVAYVGVHLRAAAGHALVSDLTFAGVTAEDAGAIAEVYRACEAARFSPDAAEIETARARWNRARTLIAILGAVRTKESPQGPESKRSLA